MLVEITRGRNQQVVEMATTVLTGIHAPSVRSREEGSLRFLLKAGTTHTEGHQTWHPTLSVTEQTHPEVTT